MRYTSRHVSSSEDQLKKEDLNMGSIIPWTRALRKLKEEADKPDSILCSLLLGLYHKPNWSHVMPSQPRQTVILPTVSQNKPFLH